MGTCSGFRYHHWYPTAVQTLVLESSTGIGSWSPLPALGSGFMCRHWVPDPRTSIGFRIPVPALGFGFCRRKKRGRRGIRMTGEEEKEEQPEVCLGV